MSAVDSVPASQGAIPRPAAAIQGAAQDAAAPGFGDALSARLSSAGEVGIPPTRPLAASGPDKAAPAPAGPAAAAAAPTPVGAKPLPTVSQPSAVSPKPTLASGGKAAAPAELSVDAQETAPGDAIPKAPSLASVDTAARDAVADLPAPLSATQPATPLIALATLPAPQDASPPPSARNGLSDALSTARSGTGLGDTSAAPTSPPSPAAPTAAAATPPPLAPAAPLPSFAERMTGAVSTPNGRLSASASGKTAAQGSSAASASASVKPASVAASLDAVVTPAAVTVVATADPQTGGGQGDDGGGHPAGGGFTPADAASASAAASAASPSAPVAGAPDTVASFAAALVQRLGQRISRFQVVLNPEGLGQVDVSMKIDADGALSAHIACDKDGGADALKARTGELAASLQQAGFSISADALRIDAPPPAGSLFAGADASGGEARDQRPSPAAWRGADLTTLDAGADLVPAAYAIAGRSRGLDIRI